MKARLMALAALLIFIGAANSFGAPSTNPPVATGPQSLAGFGGAPGAHEFFLQPGSSWKGDLIVGAGVTYSLVILDIDATGLTALDGHLIYFNLQDAETGSAWQHLGINVYMNYSGAGGGTLFQCYQTWTGEGMSSHGLNPGVLTAGDFDLRFDFTRPAMGTTWTVTPYFRLSAGTWTPFVGGSFVGTVPLDFTGGKIAVAFDGGMDGTLVFGNCYLEGPPSTVYVDDNWAGLSTGDPVQFAMQTDYRTFDVDAFASIQDGIDNVVASTVYVAPGTYNEAYASYVDILIDKPLSLIGAGSSQTIVELRNGPADGVSIGSSDVLIQGFKFTKEPGEPYGPGFNIRAGINVPSPLPDSLNDITLIDIESEHSNSSNVVFTGSYVFHNITMTDCNVHHSYTERCFYQSPSTTISNFVITDCNFDNAGYGDPNVGDPIGFNLQGTTDGLTITGGTFNNDPNSGITMRGVSNAIITDVTVAGSGTKASGDRSGIGIWEDAGITSNIEIVNPTVTNCGGRGLMFGTWGYTVADISVTGGTVSGSGNYGMMLYSGGGGSVSGIDLDGLTITGSTSYNFLAYGDASTCDDISIQHCTITNSPTAGVYFYGCDGSNCEVNSSNIYGNTEYGVRHLGGSGTLDATCNWWGAASGPTTALNLAGTGDELDGNISYIPWLTAAYPVGECDGYPADNIAVDPLSVRCLSYNLPCDTVDVLFSRFDTTPVRGVSVTFELSPELELCDPNIWLSIREGTYLSSVSGTHFEVTSLGSGLYTVDCAILGIPCGATGNGVLFTVDIQGSGGDGTGTVTVTDVTVRDCLNAPVVAFPGAPIDVTIDHTAPVAIGDISSAQVKTGNGIGHTTGVTVTFGAPGDAAVVEVYRAGYGDYPEYDDGTGAEPAAPVGYPPGAPWALTSVTVSGQVDSPPYRDFWYYVVYTKDACGNVSLVSNKTTGTLNYHLGDVTDGATPGNGDNLVNSVDISLLGTHYWSTLIHGDPVNYLDVGPTTDYSVDALPTTDNQVQFEDLMMFAINFGQVSLLADAPSRVMETPGLRLVVDDGSDIVTVRLVLDGNHQITKGLHAVVDYGTGLELLSFSKGGLWVGQGGPIFLEHLDESGVVQVDGAVLGRGVSLHGSGAVCELRFRVVGEVSELPHLVSADLRDRENHGVLKATRHVDTGESESAARVEFGARPNPFAGGTSLHFSIPSQAKVTLRVFDVNGRLVTTLVDEDLSAGRHRVEWESAGVSPGVYMAILQAGSERETRKLTLLP